MTLPSSGSITLGQIRTELGHSGAIGLHAAEIGTYGAINVNSSSRPDGSNPNTMGEWRGYDHAAGGSPTFYSHSLGYNFSTKESACIAVPTTYYSDCSTLGLGCALYTDSEGTTAAPAGWYATGEGFSDIVYGSDGLVIETVTTCGA